VTVTAYTRQCDNCGELLTPRGGLPPRFCPRCGCRLPPVAEAPYKRAPAAAEGTCSSAIAALVLGILGIPMGCVPLGLLAVFLGVYARGKIEESGGRLSGGGMATAGIVLGVISSGLWLAVCAGSL
jgi:hypothetical protein